MVISVEDQIIELTAATGLVWEYDETGGGHDALFAYFDYPADYGMEYPRLAYVMLTCDASIVEVGRDSYATLGFYPDANGVWDDYEKMAYLNDESFPPLSMADLVGFVGSTLRGWAII